MLRVFGIRHHGPGSTLSLIKALQNYQPDCILMEAPFEANTQISLLNDREIQAPVALLVYEEKTLKKAAYLPFADFSPEWQAIQYTFKNNIPLHCIDLPMSIQMSLSEEDSLLTTVVNQSSIARDPLGYLAHLQGYEDSEQWWNDTFEESDRTGDIFPAIRELIATIRREANREESKETLIREAFMRKQIRKSLKDGFEKIAVVCGAWHAPVLQDTLHYKISADNAILRGLPKLKVKATWIPWSYERLSKIKGYNAGVLSPAWYELLFSVQSAPEVNWMSKVSILFRENGLSASPAHTSEAIRLAQTLAALRDKRAPGLSELDEAALVVFCHGNKNSMNIIRQQLIIGDKVGYIPHQLTQLPIQKDFFKTIKSTRLSKYWEQTGEYWLKSTSTNPRGGLDLRNKNDLLKSHFLHRLNILEIHWGHSMNKTGKEKGSFKEIWRLKWDPLFIIQIIEAGRWGNTIYDAALAKIIEDAKKCKHLGGMVSLVNLALKAGLEEVIQPLAEMMTTLLAETEDCLVLMESLPPFIHILEYGDVRKTDLFAIEHYISEIVPRICLELPGYCHQLDESQSKIIAGQIINTNAALKMLNNDYFLHTWINTLSLLADVELISPEAKGTACRLLFDQNNAGIEVTQNRMSLALSPGNEPINIARWLEGFLNGSGLLLVHFPPLWQLIDHWVTGIHQDAFRDILPLLRRTFAKFTSGERSRMMQLVKSDRTPINPSISPTELSPSSLKREKILIPILKKLLN